MESVTSAAEITTIVVDLPIYMLQHMARPSALVQEGLIQFLDDRMSMAEDDDIHWDLRMGNALGVLALCQHPNTVDLCVELFGWLEDASPYLQQKVIRILEHALTPSEHHHTARRWLRTIEFHHPLHLPLTLLASKSGVVEEDIKDIILLYWKEDPIVGAQLMGATKNEVFMQLLERELTWLAPFVRYLMIDEEKPQTRIVEHDLWTLVGEAWFTITNHHRPVPAWLNPNFILKDATDVTEVMNRHQEWHEHLDVFLMEKFGADLPWTRDEWLKKIDSSPEFNRWKNRFLEALQATSLGKFSTRKGLRLVPMVE